MQKVIIIILKEQWQAPKHIMMILCTSSTSVSANTRTGRVISMHDGDAGQSHLSSGPQHKIQGNDATVDWNINQFWMEWRWRTWKLIRNLQHGQRRFTRDFLCYRKLLFQFSLTLARWRWSLWFFSHFVQSMSPSHILSGHYYPTALRNVKMYANQRNSYCCCGQRRWEAFLRCPY